MRITFLFTGHHIAERIKTKLALLDYDLLTVLEYSRGNRYLTTDYYAKDDEEESIVIEAVRKLFKDDIETRTLERMEIKCFK